MAAEEIAALRKVAGDAVATRIRHEPDPVIMKIVEGWPRNFAPTRAPARGDAGARHGGLQAESQA